MWRGDGGSGPLVSVSCAAVDDGTWGTHERRAVMFRRLTCRLRGHRLRFGKFDRDVLAHDLWCERCGLCESAKDIIEALTKGK